MGSWRVSEFVVGVAFFALLVVLFWPKVMLMQARGRQAEAATYLSSLVTMERGWRLQHGVFWGGYPSVRPLTLMQDQCVRDNPLGFQVEDCAKTRYTYSVRLTDAQGQGFVGVAQEWSRGGRRVFTHCRVAPLKLYQERTRSGYWIDKVRAGHDRWEVSLFGDLSHAVDGSCR
jgi:hypothetical protein